MDIPEVFGRMPFNEHLGIELLEAENGRAVGELELSEIHSSSPDRLVAHGGVAYALADTVAGAAVVSMHLDVTPTIDVRIDYLSPATGGTLHAVADVVCDGGSVAAVEVTVSDEEETAVASARGTYKTSDGGNGSAWRGDETD